jgi:hypothetical protein
LGGTVSGGGNQINNVIIGTTTPLAGAFTTLSNLGLFTNFTNAAKTSGSFINFRLLQTNEAVNYAALQGRFIGAAAAADRVFSLQTVDQGLANDGILSLQPDGGTVRLAAGGGATTIGGGLAVTGTLSATGIISSTATAGQVFVATSGTTAIMYGNLGNTGGTFLYGVDNSAGNALYSGGVAYAGFIATTGATPLILSTNGASRVTVSSAGNVGVGMTNPQTSLETTNNLAVRGAFNSGTAAIYLSHGQDPANAVSTFIGYKAAILAPAAGLFGRATEISFALNSANDSTNATIADAKLTILESGNVGIGLTSPGQTLHLKSETSANVQFEDTTSGTAGYVGPSANNQSDTTATRLGVRGEAGIAFGVGAQTKMVLDSSGKLLVGTASSPSSAKLAVAGGLSVNNNTDSATNSNNYGNVFAKTVSVDPSTTTTIKNATGSEAAMNLVSGVNLGTGARFFDIVVTMTSTLTPVVVSSGERSSPPARTYSMSGENLQINFGGAIAFIIYVTGIGANEAA